MRILTNYVSGLEKLLQGKKLWGYLPICSRQNLRVSVLPDFEENVPTSIKVDESLPAVSVETWEQTDFSDTLVVIFSEKDNSLPFFVYTGSGLAFPTYMVFNEEDVVPILLESTPATVMVLFGLVKFLCRDVSESVRIRKEFLVTAWEQLDTEYQNLKNAVESKIAEELQNNLDQIFKK